MHNAEPGSRRGRRWLTLAVAVAAAMAVVAVVAIRPWLGSGDRTTPVHDPPVLAGQQLWGACAGGFYARLGDMLVLTSSGHCAGDGTTAYAPDGTVRGVFGPNAQEPTCVHANKKCKPSDMNYLVVADDQIPWGRLNLVDFGEGGYRSISAGTEPLACEDIRIGDEIEINGRNIYRSGEVAEKGEYLQEGDGDYFPCIVAARVQVATGDSGGAVLVNGVPGGVTSRSFGGLIGFTPLAEGLAHFGMELCATPDCDLERP